MSHNKNIKIIVATHKKYNMPEDIIYMPIHVGKAGKEIIDESYVCDDTGDNISAKNPYYCELTGLYWVWRNIHADYIGLAHYRRHFGANGHIATYQDVSGLLESTDVILPRKRKYYIETLYNHYCHTLKGETLDETYKIIAEKYPEYLPEMERLRTRTSAHLFNMCIMRYDIFCAYCTWLFDVLGELESRLEPSQYDTFHARYLGRISELLLDVWLATNLIPYKEMNIYNTEKTNFPKKLLAFLRAKFLGHKYTGSF